MSKQYLFLILFIAAAAFFSCGSSDKYSIEVKDGANFIDNVDQQWGETPEIELVHFQTIGSLETEDENYMLFRPIDVFLDKEENIYVLDMGNFRIQKYSTDGKYIQTFGRQGGGPGELSMPLSMAIDSQKNLLVTDFGNSRIQKFTMEGKENGTYRMTFPIALLRLLSTDEVVSQSFPTNPTESVKTLIKVCGLDGSDPREFGNISEYSGEDILNSVINIAGFYDVDSDDNIIFVFQAKNRIHKYSADGTFLWQTKRPLNYEIMDKPVMREFEMGDIKTEVPLMSPVNLAAQIDGKDRIWVITYRNKIDMSKISLDMNSQPEILLDFHIFDKDGIFLGVIELEKNYASFRIFGDRLFAIDPSEEMCIEEFRIVEK
ncbi:NHL repeat-containing protein [candidate division KSB1 bacterium]